MEAGKSGANAGSSPVGEPRLGTGRPSTSPSTTNRAHAATLNQQASQLFAMGRKGEARNLLIQAARLNPSLPDTHLNMAIVSIEMRDLVIAERALAELLRLKPRSAPGVFHLGLIAQLRGETEKAEALYRQAIGLGAEFSQVYSNLGTLLRNRYSPEARRVFEAGTRFGRDDADLWLNLANLYAEERDFEKAERAFKRVLEINPRNAEAYNNLGSLYCQQREYERGVKVLRQALAIDPTNVDARFSEACVQLKFGNFKEGWVGYEQRLKLESARGDLVPGRIWQGENLEGRRLLVQSEQGLGDSLQFLRYIPLLHERIGDFVVRIQTPLVRLARNSCWPVEILSTDEALPKYDLFVPLLSLPKIFGTEIETIPAATPYLRPFEDEANAWRAKLEPFKRRRIGLVWTGAPRKSMPDSHIMDRQRSVVLAQLAPVLAAGDGADFFSLQIGESAAQLKDWNGKIIHDLTEGIRDFADTAALVANLDLVITVDTSTAHLAGALGKPTWVLSRHNGCWRWLHGREDSPWYPGIRVFHQTKPADWTEAIANLASELKRWLR